MNVAALMLLLVIVVSVLGGIAYEQFRGTSSILRRNGSCAESTIDPNVFRRMRLIEQVGTLTAIALFTMALGFALRQGALAACVPSDARFVISSGWPLPYFVSLFYSLGVCWIPTYEFLHQKFPGEMSKFVVARSVELQKTRYSGRYGGWIPAVYGKTVPTAIVLVGLGIVVAIFGLKA